MDRLRHAVEGFADWDMAPAVTALDADDVADLVRHARRAGLRIATQPTGAFDPIPGAATDSDPGSGANTDTAGNAEAAIRTDLADDTIILRTGRLTEVTVCPRSRTARIGAGVTGGQLTAGAAESGLIAALGGSPRASVVGHLVRGGIGSFARKHGLSSDHVTAFEVVDADGNRLRASAHENEDLFWALSGGGEGFAIVTAVELRLHAEPELTGGAIAWPVGAAGEVLAAFREAAATAPEELTMSVTLTSPSRGPALVILSLAHLGAPEEARARIKPFDAIGGAIADTLRDMDRAEIGSLGDGTASPTPVRSRTELLTDLDDAATAALLASPMYPLTTVRLRQLGGQLARFSTKGPHGAIAEQFQLSLAGSAATPEISETVAAKQDELIDALGETVTGRKPLAMPDPGTAAQAFGAEELTLLREIKAAWDPAGVFVDGR